MLAPKLMATKISTFQQLPKVLFSCSCIVTQLLAQSFQCRAIVKHKACLSNNTWFVERSRYRGRKDQVIISPIPSVRV